jgi:hypothetical protein
MFSFASNKFGNKYQRFLYACEDGDISTVKFYFAKVDYTSIVEGFRLACNNGNTEVVRYLVECKPTLQRHFIDVFVDVCCKRYLDIILILLRVGVSDKLYKNINFSRSVKEVFEKFENEKLKELFTAIYYDNNILSEFSNEFLYDPRIFRSIAKY